MRNKKKKNNNYNNILLTTVKAIKDVIIKEESNMKMLECAYPDKEDDNEFAIMQQQINEKDKKIQELEKENKEIKKKYLALLIGQFPDTTKTYKKYKKELDELLKESECK